jgi:hypothetical protein
MINARSDEGFSLLEVLFASFIAFFVLTAIYAVIITSASEGRIASSDVVSTNLAQLVVEQARSLPYESVGVTPTPAGQVGGVMKASEDTTYQGTGFTIKREVYWVADALNAGGDGKDYKRLVVSVSWKGGHATPVVTFIRDRTNETPIAPTVAWFGSPPPSSVLFTKDGFTQIWNHSTTDPWGSAGIASLQATASIDSTSIALTRMDLLCNNRVLYSRPANGFSFGPWPNPAYMIDLGLTTSTPVFGTPYFNEGLNTLKVLAMASNSVFGYQILLVTVDNWPPVFKSGAVVTLTQPDDNQGKYASSLSMTWPVALDGRDAAQSYDMTLSPPSAYATTTVSYRNVPLGTSGDYPLSLGSPTGFTPLPGMPYQVSLLARSVRGLPSTSTATSGYVCTSPRLDGKVANLATQNIMNNNFEFRLNLTHTYDAAILAAYGGKSIQYDLYSVNAATYQYPGSGNLSATTPGYIQCRSWDGVSAFPADITITTAADSCNEYLQVEERVMAADGLTVLQRIRSNVVGPPRNASGVYAPPAKGSPGKPSVPLNVTIP